MPGEAFDLSGHHPDVLRPRLRHLHRNALSCAGGTEFSPTRPQATGRSRAEKNPEAKTDIIRRLPALRAPEAREYLLELLE